MQNLTPADGAALNQDLQRAGQAVDAAEGAAKSGDRGAFQTRMAEAWRALDAAKEHLAKVTQRHAPAQQQPSSSQSQAVQPLQRVAPTAPQAANRPPIAKLILRSGNLMASEGQALNLSVPAGGTAVIGFSGAPSSDPDGSTVAFRWLVNGAQVSAAREFNLSLGKGTHQVSLAVRDNAGAEAMAGATINVSEQVAVQPSSPAPSTAPLGQTQPAGPTPQAPAARPETLGNCIGGEAAPFLGSASNPFERAGLRGYCTWYAAERWLRAGNKEVPSTRNANLWLEDARNRKLRVDGTKPVPGSLLVLGGSGKNPAGHVAYVESVDERAGTLTIRQMNAGNHMDSRTLKTECFDRVTTDTLRIGAPSYKNLLRLGFIYPTSVSTQPQIAQPPQRVTPAPPQPTPQTANRPPIAKLILRSGALAATDGQGLQVLVPAGGTAGISFSAAPSSDPDGSLVAFRWIVGSAQVNTAREFNLSLGKGTHQVSLTVRDNAGAEASARATITVAEQVARPVSPAPSQPAPSPTLPQQPGQTAQPPARPDPQLLAQVQQVRSAWQALNGQVSQMSNLQPTDRAALSQDLQRGSPALDAAEAAARRGDRATVQAQLAQAQQVLGAVSQRLSQIASRPQPTPQQPPRTAPPSALSPQATLSPPGPFSLSGTTRCSGASPEVLLSWNASPGAKTYALLRNGQVYRDYTYVGTSLTFLNQEVVGGTRYTYVVRAKNEAGQTRDSNSVAVTAPACRR